MENQLQSSEELVRFGIDPRLQACFAEINEVLRKHQLEGRIALKVIHSHFDIASDEALFETSDPERRELLLTPVKKSELKPEDVFISEVDPLSLRPLTFCPFKMSGCKSPPHPRSPVRRSRGSRRSTAPAGRNRPLD